MRLGIIGTGRIANRFVPENALTQGFDITAVYNPRKKSAEEFAQEWKISLFTADWEEFCNNIDAVYVASPHETHYQYTKELLMAGKHVLCEKPLSFSAESAKELFAIAAEKKLVLMEAVKTAYCPGFRELMRVAQSGIIGEIKDVEACFTKLTKPDGRELNSEKYAGSFYELGTYALLPAIKLLGPPKQVFFQHICSGVQNADGFTKAHLVYENAFALAKTGLTVKSEGCLIISGTKGYIWAESPWWLTRKYEVRFEDTKATQIYIYPFEGQGLRYEITEFQAQIDAIERGDVFNSALKTEESVWMAGVMEQFACYK